MSWFGGLNDSFNQFTSITGQIGGQLSNLTKEVLTESDVTDENNDYEAEARRLAAELKRNEVLLDDLKQENSLLKEKVNKIESEISTSNIVYEAKLQEAKKENFTLKHKISVSEGYHRGGAIVSPILSSSLKNAGVAEDDDDDDLHEIINYRREIERLSSELEKIRQESEGWRKKAEHNEDILSAGFAGHNADAPNSKARELEDAMRKEADHHHQEMRTIQDAHAAVVARYQDEIKKLKVHQSDSPDLNASASSTLECCQQENKMLETELNSLKEQLRNRSRQLQLQNKKVEELCVSLKENEGELLEVMRSRSSCIEELDEMKKAKAENECNKEKLSNMIEGFQKLFCTKNLGIVFEEKSVPQSLDVLSKFINDLFEEKNKVSAENATLRVQIQGMKTTTDAKGVSLAREENSSYDADLVELDQIGPRERASQATQGDQNIVYDQLRRSALPEQLDLGAPLGHSSPQVGKKSVPMIPAPHNALDLTLPLQALQKQVEDYELEIEQYEEAKSEWQVEKKSLQDLLNQYQNELAQTDEQLAVVESDGERAAAVNQLKTEIEELRCARGHLEEETSRLFQEKKQLHVATQNLSEELNASISAVQTERDQNTTLVRHIEKLEVEKEKLQSAYEILSQELNAIRIEKEDLDQTLDVLDAQHQDEMAQLLSVRDDLKTKLKILQEENAHLKEKIEDSKKGASQNRDTASLQRIEEIKTFENRVQDLEEKNKHLKMKLNEAEKDSVSKKEKENLLQENEGLKLALEQAEKKVIKAKKEVVLKEDECKALRVEMGDLHTSLTGYENGFAEARQVISEANLQHDDIVKKKELDARNALEEKDSLIPPLRSQLVENVHGSSSLTSSDERSMLDFEASLNEKTSQLEKLSLEKKKLEDQFSSEVSRLQEEIETLGAEMEDAGKNMSETQSKYDEHVRKMQKENELAIDNIQKDSQEKLRLLESNFALFRKEADVTNRVYLEKISHLEKLNEGFQKKLQEVETEDSARISNLFKENECIVENLRQKHSDLAQKYSTLLQQYSVLENTMQSDKNQSENKLKTEFEKRSQLEKECADLKNLLQRASVIETSLSTEISGLKLELENTRKEISQQSLLLEDRGEAEPENGDQVQSLLAEIKSLKKRLPENAVEVGSNLNVEDSLRNLEGFSGVEKSDLSKDDIGSLLQLIKERDNIIKALRHKQSQKLQSLSSISTEEVKRLEDENRSLIAEKDQILAVISEKTRENKKLKDDAHKMMGVMAENSAALEKVQQENASLISKYEGYDKEMTKETVVKLSRLVTEKELEIESLNQKCGTLLEVLQQQSSGTATENVSGQQVQSLIRDKETLTRQVQQLLNERNHLVALLNQRQIEFDTVQEEVAKAVEALECDSDNNSKLQIDYGNLVHDYDQSQLKLSSVQKELEGIREKFVDLQSLKTALLQKSHKSSTEVKLSLKSAELQGSSPNAHGPRISELSETLEQKGVILRRLNEDILRKSDKIESLLNDLREKDLLIHSRTDDLNRVKKDLAAKTKEAEILRKSVENLREQVAELGRNCDDARNEVRNYSSKLDEKEAESRAFQETNAQLSVLLKEKEYELENAREKYERLKNTTRENQEGHGSEAQHLLMELDNSKQALIAARHERDQIMLALKQKKIEGDKFSEEAGSLREKELKLESELARLRNHLIQVEEAYTQEAVLAEDREASLKEQLERSKSFQNATQEANELSQRQAESLQDQLRTAHTQRDQAIRQLQLSQEQGMQYATALQKLQVAVERMQREEAASFAEQLGRVKAQLEEKTDIANTFEEMANDLKVKLENANEALKSASRLNSQLELKEESITHLKSTVAEKQVQIDELQDKMHLLWSKSEDMVDKEVIKNLLISYFTSPSNKMPDVLRLIEAVLGFSQKETIKLNSGPQHGGARAWIGGWLGWRSHVGTQQQQRQGASLPASPRSGTLNESFTQMFVKFLENESVPQRPPLLPVTGMISKPHQKRQPPLSPGLASVPTPVGFTAAERAGPSVAGRYSPYLLSSNGTPNKTSMPTVHTPSSQPVSLHPITPVLPTFTPIIPNSSSEKEILRDILLNESDKR